MTRNTKSAPEAGISLHIDLDAGIRKLCGRRFRAQGQFIVEIVSQLIEIGAKSIRIDPRRNQLEIRSPGTMELGAHLDLLLRIFDPTLDDRTRQEALIRLENEFGLGLLAPFTKKNFRTSIEWAENGKNRRVLFRYGRPPALAKPTGYRGIALRMVSPGGKLRDEIAYAKKQCRFSRIPLFVGHTKINREITLDDCLFQRVFKGSNFHGAVGIPKNGSLVATTELKHGIVIRETIHTSVRGLVFSGIIEVGADTLGRPISTLNKQAGKLYRQMASQFDACHPNHRDRVLSLLLKRCLARGDDELLRGVRGFSQVEGPLLDIDEIRNIALLGPIYNLDIETNPMDYGTENLTVLRLGKKTLGYLEQLCTLNFETPTRKTPFSRLRKNPFQRTKNQLRAARAFLASTPGREISDEELSREERIFLEAAQSELNGKSLDLVESPGEIRVFMTQNQKLPAVCFPLPGEKTIGMGISRSHGAVRKMVKRFTSDPSILYPALVYLTENIK